MEGFFNALTSANAMNIITFMFLAFLVAMVLHVAKDALSALFSGLGGLFGGSGGAKSSGKGKGSSGSKGGSKGSRGGSMGKGAGDLAGGIMSGVGGAIKGLGQGVGAAAKGAGKGAGKRMAKAPGKRSSDGSGLGAAVGGLVGGLVGGAAGAAWAGTKAASAKAKQKAQSAAKSVKEAPTRFERAAQEAGREEAESEPRRQTRRTRRRRSHFDGTMREDVIDGTYREIKEPYKEFDNFVCVCETSSPIFFSTYLGELDAAGINYKLDEQGYLFLISVAPQWAQLASSLASTTFEKVGPDIRGDCGKCKQSYSHLVENDLTDEFKYLCLDCYEWIEAGMCEMCGVVKGEIRTSGLTACNDCVSTRDDLICFCGEKGDFSFDYEAVLCGRCEKEAEDGLLLYEKKR